MGKQHRSVLFHTLVSHTDTADLVTARQSQLLTWYVLKALRLYQ